MYIWHKCNIEFTLCPSALLTLAKELSGIWHMCADLVQLPELSVLNYGDVISLLGQLGLSTLVLGGTFAVLNNYFTQLRSSP